jgi:hypothetical protein
MNVRGYIAQQFQMESNDDGNEYYKPGNVEYYHILAFNSDVTNYTNIYLSFLLMCCFHTKLKDLF